MSGPTDIDTPPLGVPRTARPRGRPRKQVAPAQQTSRGQGVLGRNGEVLTRKRGGNTDPFDIKKNEWPNGWEYQWVTYSVVGNKDVAVQMNLEMEENGWRPVPAARHRGKYMPSNYTGEHIIRDGQILMERPEELCKQARAEEEAKARRQMRDRDESLMGKVRNLPQGFEMGGKYRGTGGNLKMSIDPAIDAPAPNYTIADPGE